ncbi:NADH:flavin oxidoreductase [Vitiosangium sp. GDMCC 1.1324]|uniref:NADH:flavin oxidoreductase n=1 Tax=Vitiosangium sp. (strain GDMCC 1.1324) TaxID=2138576 RepID=UPI000D344F45|nr:NADH:flavin oxidoreductase [Vitiosangium sp. GDMCC 1.1324]PTL84348.1 12-oxophytodienoate reductase [Vitiosangium sp. GDMCC 1.1324]
MPAEVLFRPFAYKSLKLKNRIVMAPMTRAFSPNGVPTPEVASYYRRRAEGEVGLILSEGTVVARPSAKNDPNVPDFHGELPLAGWKRVINEVHAAGGRMAPQLWHVGSARNPQATWVAPPPVDSPSGLSRPDKKFTEPMTDEAIADTLSAFGKAAADAKRLGFDALEIHGAHGYLIDQFFWAGTNQRTDAFGGATLAERSRFAAEVVKSIRAAVGEDFVIILRLSQWKQQDYNVKLASTPQEMETWLTPLVDAGTDILHCSQRRFWEPEFEGSELNFAGWAKKLTGKPTITVGSVGLSGEFVAAFGGESSKPASLDNLLQRLEREEFDLVAVGRALLADPQWALKVREGRDHELSDFKKEALATLA